MTCVCIATFFCVWTPHACAHARAPALTSAQCFPARRARARARAHVHVSVAVVAPVAAGGSWKAPRTTGTPLPLASFMAKPEPGRLLAVFVTLRRRLEKGALAWPCAEAGLAVAGAKVTVAVLAARSTLMACRLPASAVSCTPSGSRKARTW